MAKSPIPAGTPIATPVIDAASAAIVTAAETAKNDQDSGDVDETPAVEGTIEARVLVDHHGHTANTLVLLTEAEAADCAAWADTHPDAVAYVKSLSEG